MEGCLGALACKKKTEKRRGGAEYIELPQRLSLFILVHQETEEVNEQGQGKEATSWK